ncbi:MAG: methyltransferase domain-containing protein [Alteromonadaceae bacterium]|nr:methyltransferase domain-containing protein [Alteromonadaceae bacterium]
MGKLADLYKKDYFEDRFDGVDVKRELSYEQELSNIYKYVTQGKVLDVGCGMGNFLEKMDDSWDKFGIEISEYAAEKASAKGIKIIDFDTDEGSFDLIILRGVIQHLDEPLHQLKKLIAKLNHGGYLVFLATPNTNSWFYKCFGTLPMLDPKRNFLLPSDSMLMQILKNLGLTVDSITYPYWSSPYASPFKDHLKFLLRLLGLKRSFAFWGNMMEIYARK